MHSGVNYESACQPCLISTVVHLATLSDCVNCVFHHLHLASIIVSTTRLCLSLFGLLFAKWIQFELVSLEVVVCIV